jgi:hypothetical protein
MLLFNQKPYILIFISVLATFMLGHWFWSKKTQRDLIKKQVEIKKISAAAAAVIDRPPLVEEPNQLIPANEIYNLAYKNVQAAGTSTGTGTGTCDCLYAPDAPLYPANERMNLVPPAINSPQRRVNFLEVQS